MDESGDSSDEGQRSPSPRNPASPGSHESSEEMEVEMEMSDNEELEERDPLHANDSATTETEDDNVAMSVDRPEASSSIGTGLTAPPNNGRSVARFRPVVDENGEVSYVFESDAESSNEDSDSEDEDYLPRALQHEDTAQAQTLNRRSRLRTSRVSLAALFANEEPGPSRANRNRTRGRQRRPRKPKAKKNTPPKTTRPVQVPPKIVRRVVSNYTPEQDEWFDSLNTASKYRCNLNFDIKEQESGDCTYLVGNFDLQVVELEPELLPSFTRETLDSVINGIKQITLHVNEEDNKSLLRIQIEEELNDSHCEEMKIADGVTGSELERKYYYIITKKLNYQINLCGTPVSVFGGLNIKRLFRLDIIQYDEVTKLLKMRAVMLNSGIHPEHELESARERCRGLIAETMHHFFKVDKLESYAQDQTFSQGKEDIAWFYGQIKKYHRQEVLPDISLQEERDLIPILRDYQKDAVKWMLCREKGYISNVDLAEMFLNRMFVPIELKSQEYSLNNEDADDCSETEIKTAFYSPHFGTFAWNVPNLSSLPSGGVLCDEMGLGKTVEVLSLVTLNQRKDLESEKQDESVKTPEPEPAKAEEEKGDEATSSEAEFERMVDGGKKTNRARGRKRKGRGRKRKRKAAKRAVTPQPVSMPVLEVRRPFSSPIKKRRNPSPCEFETKTPEVEMNAKVEAAQTNDGPQESAQRVGRKRKKSANTEPSKPEPTSLYERVKAIYDNELSHYSATPVLRKQFKGEFFNPSLAPKMCFECICGEGREDNRKYIVTCKICSCSQHAECVGFDFTISTTLYTCPHCTTLQAPKKIKATLIVTPATISYQWIQEIQKHVKNANLKILFYKGVSEQGYIPPSALAAYDVIITTYTVLSNELNYVDIPHGSIGGRQFRNPKRYVPIPSPLLSVDFWRICLDEAQMVEGGARKTALMALRLKSTHRWCVTGTPMNKGLEDLFGLFAFLELQPINVEFWWNTLISKAFYEKNNAETLFELFGQLVWRTCKSDVLHQLGIPPQTQILHWQTFSPLETHFYQRQFEICSERIMEKLNDKKLYADGGGCESILNKRLTQLDRGTLNGLLQPFLMLRQACVHPQMVKGNWISLNKVKGTLTMEDLLDQLIKKSSVQCAEDNRVAVSSLNAMAGLYLIRENYVEASKKYREVLEREAKYRDRFKTDSLQIIHTLENLADVLDGNYAGVGYTLRDDTLRSEANELKQKYLESYAAEVEGSRKVIAPVTLSITKLESKLAGSSETWWVSTLIRVAALNLESTLIHRVKDELSVKSSKKKQVGSIVYLFTDLNGLQSVLIRKILAIEALRNSVQLSLTDLEKHDPHSLVEGAVSCHLRKGGKTFYNDSTVGYKCTLCSYHDQFLQYESELFAEDKTDKITRTGRNYQKFKIGGRTVDQLTAEELDMVLLQEQEELADSTEHAALKGILRQGTWGPSECERALKIIHGFSKLHGMSQRVMEDGSNHLKLFEAAKKEFKLNRILWRKIYDQVSALDELDQATTRLRLATAAEMRQSKAASESETPSTSTSTPTSTNRRKTKVPMSLQSRLGYTQESDEKIQTIHILKSHEVEPKMHQSHMEFVESDHQLTVHLGQVMYLETLKKSGYGKKGTTNSDECPICTSPLGYEWCVLVCGHSFCSECVKKLCPNPAHSLPCPKCRMTMKFADISFVDTKVEEPVLQTSSSEEPQPSTSKGITTTGATTFTNMPLPRDIIGSHSSKVGQLLEVLIKLETTHPEEKVIIFSSWVEVLEIVSRALEQNYIKFCLIKAGKNFQKSLQIFKTRPGMQVLLMPMSSGSKGLNIIEATHVFLVEPTLNLANELQAIGRVHRIGQTKPTFVHRFYMRNTIEEQLYDILKTQDISSDDEGSLTVADLKNLVLKRR